MKLTYRKALQADTEYLLWLRKETMNEHLTTAGFEVNKENHKKGLLYKFEDAYIILLDGRKIGLLKITEQKKDIVEIIQIQIQPDHQGQGIGQRVIKKLISEASITKSAVTLSVLKGNKAKRLYEKLGFKTVGENEHSFFMMTETKKAYSLRL